MDKERDNGERENGQLLLISGFLIAIGLVTITLMLNNVIYTGNIAYAGMMDTSNNDVSQLSELTHREMNNAYRNASYYGPFDNVVYNSYVDSYASALSKLYAYKGSSLKVTNYPFDIMDNEYNCKLSFINGDCRYTVNALGIPVAPLPLGPPSDPFGTPTRLVVYPVKDTVVANNLDSTRVWVQLKNDAGINISKSGYVITFATTRGTIDATTNTTAADGSTYVVLKGGPADVGYATVSATCAPLMPDSTTISLVAPPPPPPGTDPAPGHNLSVTLSVINTGSAKFLVTCTITNTGTTELSKVSASLFYNVTGAKLNAEPVQQFCPNNLSVGDSWTVTWNLVASKANKEFKFLAKGDATCNICKQVFVRSSERISIIS